MGDFVFKKSKNGEFIVAQRPGRFNAQPSEAQKAQRERFALAIEYARAVMADPGFRVVYEEIAAKEGKGAFAAARSDYFKGRSAGKEINPDPHRRFSGGGGGTA